MSETDEKKPLTFEYVGLMLAWLIDALSKEMELEKKVDDEMQESERERKYMRLRRRGRLREQERNWRKTKAERDEERAESRKHPVARWYEKKYDAAITALSEGGTAEPLRDVLAGALIPTVRVAYTSNPMALAS